MSVQKIVKIKLAEDRGSKLQLNGKNLYNPHNPLAAVRKKIPRSLAESTLYILPGVLLGYGVLELLAKLPKSSFLLAVDVDEQLWLVGAEQNFKASENFARLLYESGEIIEKFINDLDMDFKKCEILNIHAVYSKYKDLYDDISRQCYICIKNLWLNRLTLRKLGGLWIRNFFINSLLLANSPPLSKLYTNKSIIVAGAGSSLGQHFDFLRKNRSSFILLCVDTALLALLEHNIQPDIVLNLDAQLLNVEDFYASYKENYQMVMDMTANPNSISQYRKQPIMITTEFSTNKLLERFSQAGLLAERCKAMGSVGVTAVNLALTISTANVFLIGLDFCYRLDSSHISGSSVAKKNIINSNRYHSVLSASSLLKKKLLWVGASYYTDMVMLNYAKQLDYLFSSHKNIFFMGVNILAQNNFFASSIKLCQHQEALELCTGNKLPVKAVKKTSKPTKAQLRQALKNEIQILDNLVLNIKKYREEQANNAEGLRLALNECNYICQTIDRRSSEDHLEAYFLENVNTAAHRLLSLLKSLLLQ